MLTYIAAFIFYTLAMVGILLVGFIIYKKTLITSKNDSKGLIKVLDTVAIAPKKTLMVVRVRSEKFLIALDSERTTFLAKLSEDAPKKEEQQKAQQKSSNEDKLQQQFRELYALDNTKEPKQEVKPDRKEMIKRLLRDLNETQTGLESRY